MEVEVNQNEVTQLQKTVGGLSDYAFEKEKFGLCNQINSRMKGQVNGVKKNVIIQPLFSTEVFRFVFDEICRSPGVLKQTYTNGDLLKSEIITIPNPKLLESFLGEGFFKTIIEAHPPADCSIGAFCCHEESKEIAGSIKVTFDHFAHSSLNFGKFSMTFFIQKKGYLRDHGGDHDDGHNNETADQKERKRNSSNDNKIGSRSESSDDIIEIAFNFDDDDDDDNGLEGKSLLVLNLSSKKANESIIKNSDFKMSEANGKRKASRMELKQRSAEKRKKLKKNDEFESCDDTSEVDEIPDDRKNTYNLRGR